MPLGIFKMETRISFFFFFFTTKQISTRDLGSSVLESPSTQPTELREGG